MGVRTHFHSFIDNVGADVESVGLPSVLTGYSKKEPLGTSSVKPTTRSITALKGNVLKVNPQQIANGFPRVTRPVTGISTREVTFIESM